jgi:nucleotide-binding universal stress UspA family protein
MSNQHSQVVVAYDFSHSANAALYRAIALAMRAPFHVLHFVCVIEPHKPISAIGGHGPVDYRYAERAQQELADRIEQELRAANVNGRVHYYVHARIGKPAEEILGLAHEVGADLILVGSKGATGVERVMLGSVSEKVVREAGCTVEVVRPKTYDYVDLLDVREVERGHSHYVAPHRYCYEDHRANMRPTEWPLY